MSQESPLTLSRSVTTPASFVLMAETWYVPPRVVYSVCTSLYRVVQDCHKVPKLSLGYPRNQGCPRDILDTRPIVGLPLRFRGVLESSIDESSHHCPSCPLLSGTTADIPG